MALIRTLLLVLLAVVPCLLPAPARAAPTGTVYADGPCTVDANTQACSENLVWSGTDAPVFCLWLIPEHETLTCEGPGDYSVAWPYTTVAPATFELRAHTRLPTSSADYATGVLVTKATVYGLSAQTPRVCAASTGAQIQSCMTQIQNNQKDQLRITKTIDCTTGQVCSFKLVSFAANGRDVEIYGATPQIAIRRASASSDPVFQFQSVSGVSIHDLKIVDSVPPGDTSPAGTTPTDEGSFPASCPLVNAGNPYPIWLIGATGVHIQRVTIRSCGMMLMAIQSASDIMIRQSYLQGAGYYGLWFVNVPVGQPLDDAHAQQHVNTTVVIANDTLTGAGANALYLGGIDNGTVTGNTLYRNHRQDPFGFPGGQILIEAGDTNLEFKGNAVHDTIVGSGACGIEFAPTTANAKIAGIAIHGSTIHHSQGDAISFNDAEPASTPAKPFLPDNIRIFGNTLYANSLASGSGANIRYPASGLRDVDVHDNLFGSASNSPSGTFLATASTCVPAAGSTVCSVPVSWSSANAAPVRVTDNDVLFDSRSAGTRTATGVSAGGSVLLMTSTSVPNEPIARHFVYASGN